MGHWRAVSRNLSFMSRPASGYELIRSQGFEWKINFPPVGKRDYKQDFSRRRSPWQESYKTFGIIFTRMKVARISGIRRDAGGDSCDRGRHDSAHRLERQQRVLAGWQRHPIIAKRVSLISSHYAPPGASLGFGPNLKTLEQPTSCESCGV